jgi:hypothetical protein
MNPIPSHDINFKNNMEVEHGMRSKRPMNTYYPASFFLGRNLKVREALTACNQPVNGMVMRKGDSKKAG